MKNILFVEDDEIDQMQIKRVLRKNQQYNSTIVNDGIEALNYVNSITESEELIIVSDVNMPNMNGISLLREIKANKKTARFPFFLFVISESDTSVKEAEKLGVSGFFQKPFSLEKFEETLKNMDND